MIELELKILLTGAKDARAVVAAAKDAALVEAPTGRRRLRSIYFDTPDRRLAKARIALRLRRKGRAWVQTVKRSPPGGGAGGLYAMDEDERPAPGGRLDLAAVEPGLRDAVEDALGDAPLIALFETDVQRTTLVLAPPSGRVELALDAGLVFAGEAEAPLFEAEFELLEGTPVAIYEAAQATMGSGGWRFSERSKAERGHALAEGRPALPTSEPRRARRVSFGPASSAEAAAAAALAECLSQIDANAAACLASDAPRGPHQLRVGLRRLRSALGLWRDELRSPGAEAIAEQARALAAVAGTLRDLDVQIDDVLLPRAQAAGPDAEGFAALAVALSERREAARTTLREALEGPRTRRLLLDLSAFIALRGWLRPEDHGQTACLARPAGSAAEAALRRRWKRVRRAATAAFDPAAEDEARHALRKELKKLRYGVEFLSPAFPPDRVKPFRKRLKALQDRFGALNDAAVAEAIFSGETPPAADDPRAQRAAGRLLGRLSAEAEADREAARMGWDALIADRPFWR